MTHKIPEQYLGQDVAYCGKCQQWKPKHDFHKDAGKPSGVHARCKLCVKEWRVANSEHLIQKAMEWQRNNPERTSAAIREWNTRNPDKVRTYRKNDNKKQWEKIKGDPILSENYYTQRKRYPSYTNRKNKQKISLEAAKAKRHLRKARIFGGGGSYTQEEWLTLCGQCDNICLCCKEKKPLTIDHVIPLSRGGTNSIDNIQPLCRECNSRKGPETIDYRSLAT